MTLNKVVIVAIIATFLILFPPESFPFTSAVANDIQCLQSMKESLQDPFGYLTSAWNFDNITEGSICDFVGVDCWHDNENKVLNIKLSNMGLKGLFPLGLEMCTSLTGLNLSSNYFSGPIPLDIGQNLRFITSLDLSNNNFSGLIPPSLATCNYLGSLKLDNNNLSGSIPSDFGLMSLIHYFSVSNNSLTGPVPNFIKASPILFYANNPGLCGQYPLKKCKDIGSVSGNSNRALFFSGFLTGWAVTASLVIFICLFGKRGIALEKLITKKKNMKKKPKVDEKNLWPKAREIDNTHKMAKLERYITRIPFAELTKATANFSQDNVIGIGKMGTMYKARIPNGWFLAIKKLFNSEQLDRQLASEIITLGRLKHCRLVHLIGFRLEKQDIFLVYKYMSNGNLYNWLHNRISSEGDIIGYWPLRVKVAVAVAEGLAWLHHKCSFMVVLEKYLA
ncbi:hypothetical protein ACH5RR_008948 [Cinchona calisaya]|uniref:non-specific serine/threonine protein kinase n=1 Tax=Cinchona calisaya TaxID=153742 RepID=A0ABD3ACX2_9GENT